MEFDEGINIVMNPPPLDELPACFVTESSSSLLYHTQFGGAKVETVTKTVYVEKPTENNAEYLAKIKSLEETVMSLKLALDKTNKAEKKKDKGPILTDM